MRRTKAEAAETRAAIVVAAEQLFFEKGVSNSTLDEIAAAAGVTRGAIYWHFESKTDLFLELYNAARLPQVNMELQSANCDDRDALAFVEQSVCDWLEMLAGDEQRQRLLSILLRTNFTDEFRPVQSALQELEDAHKRNIEQILQRADLNGRLAAGWTPHAASKAVGWLINGICWDWLLFGQKFDMVKDGSDSVHRLFASFRSA